MNLDKVLNESLDGMWNNRQYGGTSESPRKDYQPMNSKDGYSFPYQAGSPPIFPPTSPTPENIPSIPWPLNTVTDDLADAFVYLVSAVKKMHRCVEENPAPSKQQKEEIKKMMNSLRQSLLNVEKVGAHIIEVSNLAGQLPPQSPQEADS